MNCNVFKQIKHKTNIDEDKNYVTVTFPQEKREYRFEVVNGGIRVEHKSHAVIAAVTGRTIFYKSKDIQSVNRVFEWLGVEYNVDFKQHKLGENANLVNGIISFFPE